MIPLYEEDAPKNGRTVVSYLFYISQFYTRTITTLICLVFISSCASPPPKVRVPCILRPATPLLPSLSSGECPPPWGVRNKPFSLTARVVIKPHQQDIVTMNIEWQHSSVRDQMQLHTTFMGAGIGQLEYQLGKAQFTDHRGRVYQSKKPEELMETHLGWAVPIIAMSDWVQGYSSLDPHKIHLPSTMTNRFSELGWNISVEYIMNKELIPSWPRQVVLQKLDSKKPIEIRLLIDEWQWEEND